MLLNQSLKQYLRCLPPRSKPTYFLCIKMYKQWAQDLMFPVFVLTFCYCLNTEQTDTVNLWSRFPLDSGITLHVLYINKRNHRNLTDPCSVKVKKYTAYRCQDVANKYYFPFIMGKEHDMKRTFCFFSLETRSLTSLNHWGLNLGKKYISPNISVGGPDFFWGDTFEVGHSKKQLYYSLTLLFAGPDCEQFSGPDLAREPPVDDHDNMLLYNKRLMLMYQRKNFQ